MKTQIATYIEDEYLYIDAPFSTHNNTIYRSRGGKFDRTRNQWKFPQSSATDTMIHDLFGVSDTLVKIEISFEDDFVDVFGNTAQIGGYVVASRPSRDSGVRMPEGVVLARGSFDTSGGSVKNPRVTGDDMVFHVIVREDFAEAHNLLIIEKDYQPKKPFHNIKLGNDQTHAKDTIQNSNDISEPYITMTVDHISNIVSVPILKIHPDAVIPQYAHAGDSGVDIYTIEDVALEPCVPQAIRTGIKVACPEGYEFQIRSRSGLTLSQQVVVANSPGTIDSTYRGEICVICIYFGDQTESLIPKHTKIAQMVLCPVYTVAWEEVNELSTTKRGEHGFGSTG